MPASALVLAALAAAAPGPRLLPPVPGDVARAFSYAGDPFARGHHRGVDLAAVPGEPVRAACSGRVTFAGRAGTSGRAVTIRCGAWSITHLPLRHVAVRAGGTVVAGAPLGAAGSAAGHTGLHLGLRRATDPIGYVDPAPLLGARRPTPPAAGPPPRATPPRPIPPPPRPAPLRTAPPAGPEPLPSAPRAGSSPARDPARAPVAPWPVWAGLGLLLSGAVGAGTVRASRKRRSLLRRVAAREVR